jgi:hypothetical protein
MIQNMQINKCNVNHRVISIETEQDFDKSQCLFLIKVLMKLEIEGMCLNIIKVIYDEPIANIILNGEKLKPFLLKSAMRQGYVLTHSCFGIASQSNKTGRKKEFK